MPRPCFTDCAGPRQAWTRFVSARLVSSVGCATDASNSAMCRGSQHNCCPYVTCAGAAGGLSLRCERAQILRCPVLWEGIRRQEQGLWGVSGPCFLPADSVQIRRRLADAQGRAGRGQPARRSAQRAAFPSHSARPVSFHLSSPFASSESLAGGVRPRFAAALGVRRRGLSSSLFFKA
jgi:hypothetical protein